MIDFQNGSIFKLKKSTYAPPEEVNALLVSGEEVIGFYVCGRDSVTFTNKRLIALNVQGMSGKKRDFTSLPYSKIQVFSVETAGGFDRDSELELYYSGAGKVKFEFTGASDIVAIGKLISDFVL